MHPKEDTGRAEKALLEGIEANSESVLLHVALIRLFVREERQEEAVNVAKRIIQLEPDKVVHRFTLANLYWDMGQEDEVANVLNEIIGSGPDSEDY